MKLVLKTLLAFVMVSISLMPAQAQNWKTNGNAGTNANSKLGTTDQVDLRIVTNDVERIRVTDDGRVVINSTSPSEYLDVNGETVNTVSIRRGESLEHPQHAREQQKARQLEENYPTPKGQKAMREAL